MELKEAGLHLEKMRLQRNLFLVIVLIVLGGNFLLTLQLFRSKEQVIMVPGLQRELAVSSSGVSKSYLEESSLLFLSALLDLTPETLEAKRDMILKYTSSVNKKYIQQIKEYFASSAVQHKKFNMSTYFTPKELEINLKDLEVRARGTLSSNFGRKGYKEDLAEYVISFEQIGMRLKLKEFYRVNEDENNEAKDGKQ